MIVLNGKTPSNPLKTKGISRLLPGALFLLYLVMGTPLALYNVTDPSKITYQRVFAGLELVLSLAALLVLAVCLYLLFRRTNKRQRLIATPNTLSIQREGERATFINRHECASIADYGYTLILQDNRRIGIAAEGTTLESMEAFLESLYALWWPDITLVTVRKQLDDTRPWLWRWLWFPLMAMSIGLFIGIFWAFDRYGNMGFLLVFVPGLFFLILAWTAVEERRKIADNAHRFPLPPEIAAAPECGYAEK